MSKFIQKFDQTLYKYNPDQMIVRLNEIVDTINSQQVVVMVSDDKTNNVIFIGKQPDGSFGIKKWLKQGDSYAYVGGAL